MEAFNNLKSLIASIEDDLLKAEGGNKAAGTRVRSVMQDVKNAAQEVREKILNIRDAEKPNAEKSNPEKPDAGKPKA